MADNNFSPDVLKRLQRLEQLVSNLKNEDRKLRKLVGTGGSSGGGSGSTEFANGIGALTIDPTKVGLATGLMIETALINLDDYALRFFADPGSNAEFYVGGAQEYAGVFITYNDVYIQMQHHLIDDAGIGYFDLFYNPSTGKPVIDIYVEGGPGSNTSTEIYFEPGLLGFYLDSSTTWEIFDLPVDDTATSIMCLDASGRVVTRGAGTIGGGGGGATLDGNNSGIQNPSSGVFYSSPDLIVPVVTGKVTKFEFFFSIIGGSSDMSFSTKLLWVGAGAVPDTANFQVLFECFPTDGAGEVASQLARKAGVGGLALQAEIDWHLIAGYTTSQGNTFRISGTIVNNTGTNGSIQLQYKVNEGLGGVFPYISNGAIIEYQAATIIT